MPSRSRTPCAVALLLFGAGLSLSAGGCRKHANSVQTRSRQACVPLTSLDTPALPDAIGLPPTAAATPFLRLRVTGIRIYHCEKGQGPQGAWAWRAEGPEGELFDDQCRLYGMLAKGPTFRPLEGGPESHALAARAVAEADSPNPDDDAAWRRFEVTPAPAAGPLDRAHAIVEVDTHGGKAPPTGCDDSTADARVASAYQATYYFHAAATAGGTTPKAAPPSSPDPG